MTPFSDSRGFFTETYKQSLLTEALGRPYKFSQGNHSRSHKNVLRGFHSEPWDKLIHVVRGHALCVVADTRPESSTFGRHQTFHLGDAPGTRQRIFVSQGLSNAFYCFSEVDYLNDVSEEFDPANRKGFHWADPDIGVAWPTDNPILSDKDKELPTLREAYPNAFN